MIFTTLLIMAVSAADTTPASQIWAGLKIGLQKDGKPGECLNSYPKVVDAYSAFQSTLTEQEFTKKLHSFQSFFNQFNKLIATCKLESLAGQVFGIYQWSVLQPILLNLASNVSSLSLVIEYLMLSIDNQFYYDIGFYLGQLIQLVFRFSI